MGPVQSFLTNTTYEALPEEIKVWARRWLLDLLGVAAGGRGTQLSQIICDHAAAQFGPGHRSARILFDGRAVSPAGAALAGGMTIDALDGHDGHKLTKGHTGCGVLPALLALTEAEGLEDDRAFLTSLVIGYEIGTRAGIALHRSAPDYHTSGAWIALATAALGARILNLTPEQTRHAIGIAEYHGPRSQMMRCIDHPTMLKDGSGWGTMAGVSAAYLAQAGFTGAPAVTVEAADLSDLWDDLGQTWRISEQYFKAYPVCRWAQPPVQAVLNLRAQHGLKSSDIERIDITTFHQSLRLATRHPKSTEEAQYSTAYPAAVAAVRGDVTPADLTQESFSDPEILRLSNTMGVCESAEFNEAFPARRIASATLTLKDGRTVVSGPTEAIGDPEAPISQEQVEAKFDAYAIPTLGPDRAGAIKAAVSRLGEGSGISELIDLTSAPRNIA
ncbi:MmgE/PrpD family protein [Ruegeria jejuensis]|uniref:MmgE/PrpD family protein n=1 Tax=Ruegeria jejuensis TaxID=3233338 RepID=UPI00355BCBAD